MPLSEELARQVRWIEFSTRKIVSDVASGQYRSHFKGHGVQFSEHRLYVPGDDIRHIDWKVSARARDPLVKKYEEERELTVFLVVDVSASNRFGSNTKLKSTLVAEIAGMLAYAANYTGDRVGILLFTETVEKIIPPKKGRLHIQRIVRDLLCFQPQGRQTNLANALRTADSLMKHQGVIFVLSDFLAENYEIPLKRLARRHDIVAVTIGDVREREIPKQGTLLFLDPETGQEVCIDAASEIFQQWFRKNHTEQKANLVFKKNGIETLNILTHEDYGACVVSFFRARSRHKKIL